MKILSLHHRKASVQAREGFALASCLSEALARFSGLEYLDEVAVLSTCNRVEVIWFGDATADQICATWAYLVERGAEELQANVEQFEGEAAIAHFIRVCAGVDSMVLGEPQIFGQAKDAFAAAREAGTLGPRLHRFFERSFQVAKRVRSETDIAANAVSISYYAVKLARQIFGRLQDKQVLVMGAGEMAELAIRHFKEQGVPDIGIWNRTYSRARDLAEEMHASAIPTEQFEGHLALADIILVSTGAPSYVLVRNQVKAAQKIRRNKPYLVLDISVPRNADPAINTLDNVYLYDIDTLRALCDENARRRQDAVEAAESIIQQQAARITRLIFGEVSSQWLGRVYANWSERVAEELQRSLGGQHSALTEEQQQALVQAIVRKLLHPVQQKIKGHKGLERDEWLESAASLLDVPVDMDQEESA